MSRTSLGARPVHPGTRLQAFLAAPLTSDLGTILTAFRASKVLLCPAPERPCSPKNITLSNSSC